MKTFQTLRRASLLLVLSLFTAMSVQAMSYSEARDRAWYLTDKMAYELNLTQEQYDKAYQINLDYLMSIQTPDDCTGRYWRYRNADFECILQPWQYALYTSLDYFFRPIRWLRSAWYLPVFEHYRRTGVGAGTATPAPTAISGRGTDRVCVAPDVPAYGLDIHTGIRATISLRSGRRAPKSPAVPMWAARHDRTPRESRTPGDRTGRMRENQASPEDQTNGRSNRENSQCSRKNSQYFRKNQSSDRTDRQAGRAALNAAPTQGHSVRTMSSPPQDGALRQDDRSNNGVRARRGTPCTVKNMAE